MREATCGRLHGEVIEYATVCGRKGVKARVQDILNNLSVRGVLPARTAYSLRGVRLDRFASDPPAEPLLRSG
jgi:hypothetical protein